MKYQLETIPLWDAFKSGGECPLCTIAQQLEDQYIEFTLGGSVMEPDTRVKVNEQGFCGKHFTSLFERNNKLGLALITHTHMKEVAEKLNRLFTIIEGDMTRAEGQNAVTRAAGSATKMARYFEPFKESISVADKHGSSCFICNMMDETIERYAETACYLFATDAQFADVFSASKGFCLPHYALLAQAALSMNINKRPDFIRTLVRIERENIKRVTDELEWFTLKFDYRNQDKPWGNSKDAPERAINILAGRVAGSSNVEDINAVHNSAVHADEASEAEEGI